MSIKCFLAIAPALLFFIDPTGCSAQNEIRFKKIVIDTSYYSEAVTAADLNRDGLKDIVSGDVWYQAPAWTKHEIRKPGVYLSRRDIPGQPFMSGAGNASYYSRCLGNFTKDINEDGWIDVIIFNGQGGPCYWYENPGGEDGHWNEHKLIEVFHNESPHFADLFSDGNPVPFAGYRFDDSTYFMSWFSPKDDPYQVWDAHTIGDARNFGLARQVRGGNEYYAPGGRGHGLGMGDINGDGIQDVITGQGWYEGPMTGKQTENWTFHPVPFDSMADLNNIHLLFAQMFADDFDRDGDNDVLAGSAHTYGLWWFEQIWNGGKIEFVKHDVRTDISQLHSMAAADLNGDGVRDFITGKRYLAHLGRDPGSDDSPLLIWIEHKIDEEGEVQMISHVIDEDCGSGTQIEINDMNKDEKPDVIITSKKGTYLFLQF